MNRATRIILITTCALSVQACATIINGRTEAVKFMSTPNGATVTTSLGSQCTTPCELEIERKQAFEATLEMNGKVIRVPVASQMGGAGAATTMGNVIFGGVVGVGVDAATGSNLEHVPNPIMVDFTGDTPRLAMTKAQ